MISTYRKDFPWEKWPKFPRLQNKNSTNRQILLLVPIGSQKYKKISIFSYFHISTCGQIWRNRFRDDSHLDYITKLEKETLLGHSRVRTPYYCTSSLTYGSGFGICLLWKDMKIWKLYLIHNPEYMQEKLTPKGRFVLTFW